MQKLSESQALEIWLKEKHPEILDSYFDDAGTLNITEYVSCFYSYIYKEFRSKLSFNKN